MEKQNRKRFYAGAGWLAAFVLWTAAIQCVDVQPIGPEGSWVGFAALNRWVHNLTGVHMSLYTVTDWLGLIPLVVAAGFALLGLSQWIGRRSLRKVDRSLLALGGFYVAVMAVYLFFEVYAVNYRPVLIEGVLEVSYPSSTTVLVLCVMPTALMQFNRRIGNPVFRRRLAAVIAAFAVFMVTGRVVSGVHWVTDVIGGLLLSGGLVTMYDVLIRKESKAAKTPRKP